VAGNGIVVNAGQSPIKLNVYDDGDCVQREWFGISQGAANPISFIEVIG